MWSCNHEGLSQPTTEVRRGKRIRMTVASSTPTTARRFAMRGLMMDRPLLISSLLEHAAEVFSSVEIVTRAVEGPIHRYT